MLPGRPNYRLCEVCGGVIKQPRLSSGNYIRARFWSDGKVDAPMFISYPPLGACPHCDQTVWLSDLKDVPVETLKTDAVSVDLDDDRTLTLDATEIMAEVYHGLSFERMIEYANQIEDVDRLGVVRLLAWQTGNDSRREDTSIPITEEEIVNLYALIKLLDIEDEKQRLFAGEAYRELGEFDETYILLQDEMSPRNESVRNRILDLALERDCWLAEFPAED